MRKHKQKPQNKLRRPQKIFTAILIYVVAMMVFVIFLYNPGEFFASPKGMIAEIDVKPEPTQTPGISVQETQSNQLQTSPLQDFISNYGGPGGCKTVEECNQYCGLVEHYNICKEFARFNALSRF